MRIYSPDAVHFRHPSGFTVSWGSSASELADETQISDLAYQPCEFSDFAPIHPVEIFIRIMYLRNVMFIYRSTNAIFIEKLWMFVTNNSGSLN